MSLLVLERCISHMVFYDHTDSACQRSEAVGLKKADLSFVIMTRHTAPDSPIPFSLPVVNFFVRILVFPYRFDELLRLIHAWN